MPIAAAAERMVTAPMPLASASLMPAAAISARLCSGAGPRAARSGRAHRFWPGPGRFGCLVIANTVLSRICSQYSEH